MNCLNRTMIAAGLLVAMVSAAPAATLPLFEDFDDDPTGSNAPTTQGEAWTEDEDPGNSTWSVVDKGSGNHVYAHNRTEDGTDDQGFFDRHPSSIDVTNLRGNAFTISFDFRINDFDGTPDDNNSDLVRVGAKVFDGYGMTFVVDGSQSAGQLTGALFVASPNASGGFESLTSSNVLPVNTDGSTTYTLTFNGRSATPGDPTSDFIFDASLTDGTNTVSIPETTDAAELLSGNGVEDDPNLNTDEFLFRSSIQDGSGVTLDVEFDNLSIVPEPATLALLGLGGAGMLAGRKRRA